MLCSEASHVDKGDCQNSRFPELRCGRGSLRGYEEGLLDNVTTWKFGNVVAVACVGKFRRMSRVGVGYAMASAGSSCIQIDRWVISTHRRGFGSICGYRR